MIDDQHLSDCCQQNLTNKMLKDKSRTRKRITPVLEPGAKRLFGCCASGCYSFFVITVIPWGQLNVWVRAEGYKRRRNQIFMANICGHVYNPPPKTRKQCYEVVRPQAVILLICCPKTQRNKRLYSSIQQTFKTNRKTDTRTDRQNKSDYNSTNQPTNGFWWLFRLESCVSVLCDFSPIVCFCWALFV